MNPLINTHRGILFKNPAIPMIKNIVLGSFDSYANLLELTDEDRDEAIRHIIDEFTLLLPSDEEE